MIGLLNLCDREERALRSPPGPDHTCLGAAGEPPPRLPGR